MRHPLITVFLFACAFSQAQYKTLTHNTYGIQVKEDLNYNFAAIPTGNALTPENYGAVGDGYTDDKEALEDALSSGNKIYLTPGASYYVGSSIEIAGEDIEIYSDPYNPAKILFKDASNIKFLGESGAVANIKESARANAQYILVDDPVGFDGGNLFTITTDSSKSWAIDTLGRDYRIGEIHRILKINGDTLFSEDKIWHSWNYDWVTAGKIIRVREYEPITVSIKNVEFEYETPQHVSGGLWIKYGIDCYLDNVSMKDAQYTGIMFDYCYNSTFDNGRVEGANGTGLGYGLRFQLSSFNKVTNSTFTEYFKGIELSTASGTYDFGLFPTRNTTIEGNYGNGNGYMEDGVNTIFLVGSRFVNTHAPAENLFVIDNMIANYHTGVLMSGIDLMAIGNKLSGYMKYGFLLSSGTNYVVTNNAYQVGLFRRDTIGSPNVYENNMSAFIQFSKNDTSDNTNIYIANNHVNSTKTTFIGTSSATRVNNLTVLNNEVYFYNKDSTNCTMYSTINYNNFIEDGNLARSTTSGIHLSPNIKDGEFILNGDFDFPSPWVRQSIWSVSGGVAVCDATTADNTSTSIMYQGSDYVQTYVGDLFRVSAYIPTASASSSIGIYNPGTASYQFKSISAGEYYSDTITASAAYGNFTFINHAVGEPFTMDKVSAVRITRDATTNTKSVYQDKNNYYIRGMKLNVHDMNVNLPTDTTALAPGDVWIDGNTLKVKQ